MTPSESADTYVLYRAWDESTLLYIGLSTNVRARLSDHSSASFWWDRVTHIDTERLTACNKASAAVQEAAAIGAERPLFNVHANTRDTSEIRAARMRGIKLMARRSAQSRARRVYQIRDAGR